MVLAILILIQLFFSVHEGLAHKFFIGSLASTQNSKETSIACLREPVQPQIAPELTKLMTYLDLARKNLKKSSSSSAFALKEDIVARKIGRGGMIVKVGKTNSLNSQLYFTSSFHKDYGANTLLSHGELGKHFLSDMRAYDDSKSKLKFLHHRSSILIPFKGKSGITKVKPSFVFSQSIGGALVNNKKLYHAFVAPEVGFRITLENRRAQRTVAMDFTAGPSVPLRADATHHDVGASGNVGLRVDFK